MHLRLTFTACLVIAFAISPATPLSCLYAMAQSPNVTPLHIVRVGSGKVEAIKINIKASVEGCQGIKNLPQTDPPLPSDSYLATLALSEEEEYFDGQLWALYKTERSIGADFSSNCKMTLFAARSVDVEHTCESRIRGNTTLLGDLKNPDAPQQSTVTIDDDVLPPSSCRGTARPMDLTGLPRFDAGAAQCVWTSAVLARQMAKLGIATTSTEGFDTCVYADQPSYIYQGKSRPVVLLNRTVEKKGTGSDVSSLLGEAFAFGNLSLKSITVGQPIDKTVFTRARVQAFLAQPAKTSPGGN